MWRFPVGGPNPQCPPPPRTLRRYVNVQVQMLGEEINGGVFLGHMIHLQVHQGLSLKTHQTNNLFKKKNLNST